MYYAKDFGPQTSYQALSMLHAQLGSAYSIIAQYEEEERARESQRLRDFLVEEPRARKAHKDAMNAAADAVQQLADGIAHGDHPASVHAPDDCISCRVRALEYQLRGKMAWEEKRGE